MISTRLYQTSDYDTIATWWSDEGYYVPDASQLDTLGVIVTVDEVDVCYMCAYCVSGVAIAFLDHLVTNPDFKSARGKLKAVDAMISEIIITLKARGYQLIRAVTWSETLAKICNKRYGFQRCAGDMQALTLII